MGGTIPKQYQLINGLPILRHTLERVGVLPQITTIVVALSPEDQWWPAVLAALPPPIKKKLVTTPGGKERSDSVLNGLLALQAVAEPDDFVLVHDAVRPCVRLDDIEHLMREIDGNCAGGLLATPVRDTLKRETGTGVVAQTVARTQLWSAATPQMFKIRVLRAALEHVLQVQRPVTDEAEAVELLGHQVRLVQGSADNIKVTYPDDLELASLILGAAR